MMSPTGTYAALASERPAYQQVPLGTRLSYLWSTINPSKLLTYCA